MFSLDVVFMLILSAIERLYQMAFILLYKTWAMPSSVLLCQHTSMFQSRSLPVMLWLQQCTLGELLSQSTLVVM